MVRSKIDNLLKRNCSAAVTLAAFDPDDVFLRRLTGSERLGQLFHYEVRLVSRHPIQNFATIPGQSLAVGLKLKGSAMRFFHGIVTEFQYLGHDDGANLNYVAQMRPWLSLLDYRSNSRIFQNKTSIEIITTIFREHKGNFKNQTTGRFPQRSYCVQYDETDLAFVSRLMEQDGIYYYFEHAEDQHDLVLVDNAASHIACAPEIVETHHNLRPAPNLHRDDVILRWEEVVSLQPNKVVLKDYNHEKPRAELTAVAQVPSVKIGGIPACKPVEGTFIRSPEAGRFRPVNTSTAFGGGSTAIRETFVYPGRYTEKADGDFYACIRAEELACNAYRARVECTARQIRTGLIFKAANPFYYGDVGARPTPSDRFLAVASDFTLVAELGDIRTEADAAGREREVVYRSTVEIIPATTQYRPPRRTPEPEIRGPHTAVVVGPKGDTIATDQFGRIKVQFFWDREGNKDDTSSCWIRVAQSSAGKGFGHVIIPRIGQEVVVNFIHGNPDWPLVTGVVYNGSNLPPETLPLDKTCSTFRTHTDQGAVNAYNELRFEDKQGCEEVYLKAERDHTVEVGNSYCIDVKGQYLLTSAGNCIEVTPDKIRLVAMGKTGQQAIEISGKGISIAGATIGFWQRLPGSEPPFPSHRRHQARPRQR
ncbi:type VI secretion system Vgr family protein [Mesorhizobium kowhaii]|uniref:type VI secretion system Vgr family protein n=1 Tax=Mesorhizobium kowhaii TaxID=1300272 RepID=UPI0035E7259C